MEPWSPLLGTLPGWITATGIVGMFGILVRWRLGIGKQKIESDQVILANESDIRDHYAAEVQGLRSALAASSSRHLDRERELDERYRASLTETEGRYRGLLSDADQQHRSCMKDLDEQRDKVEALRDLVAGLNRIITQASVSKAIQLGDMVSSDVEAAAQRVETLFRQRDDARGQE